VVGEPVHASHAAYGESLKSESDDDSDVDAATKVMDAAIVPRSPLSLPGSRDILARVEPTTLAWRNGPRI
jgi:hypothetical protein